MPSIARNDKFKWTLLEERCGEAPLGNIKLVVYWDYFERANFYEDGAPLTGFDNSRCFVNGVERVAQELHAEFTHAAFVKAYSAALDNVTSKRNLLQPM